MKKKFLAFLLSLTLMFTFALSFTACSGPDSGSAGRQDGTSQGDGTGGNQGGDQNKPGQNPGSDTDKEKPGKDPDKDPSGDRDTDADYELKDADILTLSCDRLENADMSFRFDMGGAETKQRVRVTSKNAAVGTPQSVLSNAPKNAAAPQADDSLATVEVTPADAPEYFSDNYNLFADYVDRLEGMAQTARSMVDFAVDHITVMDTLVRAEYGNTGYVLSYDRENDVVTELCVSYHWETNEPERYEIATVYYDEDGDETVDFWMIYDNAPNIESWTAYGVEHCVYSPGKNYVFEMYSGSDLTTEEFTYHYYHVASAYKVDGLWRGISYFFDPTNPYYTHEGTYDYANGMLYFDFLSETENTVYTYGEQLIAYRDGGETGSNVEAAVTDVIRPEHYSFYAPFVYDNITVHLPLLNGWNKLTVQYNPTYYPTQNGYVEIQGVESAALQLTNGMTLTDRSAWVEGYGFVESLGASVGGSGGSVVRYRADSGEILTFDMWEDEAVNVSFSYIILNNGRKDARISFHCEADRAHNSAEHRKKFMEYCGLSWNQTYIDFDYFSEITEKQRNRENYIEEIFDRLYGRAFTYDNIVAIYDGLMEKLSSKQAEVAASLETLESISMDEMPKRPANLALIKFAENLDGAVTIAEEGIDFSATTVSVPKAVILQKEQTYGVGAMWTDGATAVLVDGYDTAVYDRQAFALHGQADVALPTIRRAGTYTLKGFLGRIDGTTMIRVSEIADLPVAEFTGFQLRETLTAEGLEYVYDYAYANGVATLTVTCLDVAPPVITVDGAEDNAITLETGVTAADLKALVQAADNVDGELTVFVIKAADSDEPLADDTALTDGVYVVTATDEAGNVGEYALSVSLLEPQA